MSVPANAAAPAAGQRPGSVTISSFLLFLTAVLLAVGAIIGLTTAGTVSRVFESAYAGTSAEGIGAIAVATVVISAVVQLLIAAGFVVLGLLNNRGKNAARITTWVIGGIGVCCTGIGLGGNSFGGVGAAGGTQDLPDPQEVQRMLEAELPSWNQSVTTTLSVISLLALLAALILLALPASNEFFRRPAVNWEPPVPGGGDPGYPSTPPAPSGGEPGYPPAPGYPPQGGQGNPPSNQPPAG